MKVIKWTEWSYDKDIDFQSKKEYDEAFDAVSKELREKGYHFDGHYHQNGDYGVPVLDNGKYFQVNQRTWGTLMAKTYPEEFDSPEDPYNYVVWYLGGKGLKYKFPYDSVKK